MSATASATAGSPARRAALPATAGPVVGRDRDVDRIGELLTASGIRLLTLTGPPGVGKTRLAVAAAAALEPQFADGVLLVDLTRVRDPDLVAGEIAAAVRPATGPDTGRSAAGALADEEVLLVLDNFEHVLAAAPRITELLDACPRLSVLVTSRERLRLRAEQEFPVLPLAVPGPEDLVSPDRVAATPAVTLLLARIRAFDPAFDVTERNAEALGEICIRLDGLPLALELAAPRLRLFDPAELLFRLRFRVNGLASDVRDVPERHRTLSTALAWSHDLLSSEERAMFRRLSVFVGGWTLDAAEQVCAVPDPLGTTASLVDKSLVRRVPGSPAPARFIMLESLREFAADQLEQAGEAEATRARSAAHFTEFALSIERRVGTSDERACIEEVGLEVGNLRATAAHHRAAGHPGRALPAATALGWYAYTRGRLGSGQAELERAVATAAHDPDTSDETLAGALFLVTTIALARGDADTAEQALDQGLRISERVDSLRLTAIGEAFQGHLARARGRVDEAVAHHEQSGRLYAQLGHRSGVAWSRYDLGLLARSRRDPSRAARLLAESLVVFRELRYGWAVGCAAWALATVELARGDGAAAARLIGEAIEAFDVADDRRGIAQCLEAAAGVACDRGEPASAAALLGAAAALRERVAAPLPVEDQGARGAVALRIRHSIGAAEAERRERAGRELATSSALALVRRVLTAPVPRLPETSQLTPREREVAELVRDGRTNRQIGRRLGISEKTTEVHVHNIIRKLGASSRAEVAAWVAAGGGSPAPTP